MKYSEKTTVLVGDGGHARSILAIETFDGSTIHHYCAPQRNVSLEADYDLHYMGRDEEVAAMGPQVELILGVSYLGQRVSVELRKKLLELFHHATYRTWIARSAIVKTEQIGSGTVIFERTLINAGTRIGENSVINSGAIIEHDCVIGNNVQISPGAIVLGGVHIADNCFIGAGAIIRDSVHIKTETIIPMGARVTQNIE